MMKKKCNNCKKTDKDSIHLVEILHKPISPYFSSYYNGIISIVCGTTMAFVFDKIYSFAEKNKINFDSEITAWKFIIIVTCIALMWHSYMKITQYKAWPLNIMDTVIPMLFSIVIYLSVYDINNIRMFSLMFSLLCGLGAWAYWNTFVRLEKKEAKNLYEIHFHKYSPVIHSCIFRTVHSFTKDAFIFHKQIATLFSIVSAIQIIHANCTDRYNDELTSLVLCFFMSSTVIYAFMHDLNRELRKIECLAKYF